MEVFVNTSFITFLITAILLLTTLFLPFEFKSDDEN